MKSPHKHIVGKRWTETIFSDFVTSEKLDEDMRNIWDNDVVVINIYRDGRDVIEGTMDIGKQVSARRWINCIRQMQDHDDLIDHNVKYEDLVSDPDTVQKHIAEIFDLQCEAVWSEYPQYIPDFEFTSITDAACAPRPISTDRIGKDPDLYRAKYPNDVAEFDKCLKQLGYI